jgi:hypothetical protein
MQVVRHSRSHVAWEPSAAGLLAAPLPVFLIAEGLEAPGAGFRLTAASGYPSRAGLGR